MYHNSTQVKSGNAEQHLPVRGGETTLGDILRWRALHQPDRLAYKFLKYSGAGCSERDWTYQELDQQARKIAVTLTNLGIYQQPVLLLFPSGLEYVAAFFGCFYAGAVAVPAYPPRHARSGERIGSILEDARPTVILTTSSIRGTIQEWLTFTSPNADITVIAVDTLPDALAHVWQEPSITPDSLAFLQYTSGSTASPKGVMVSHGNLIHNSKLIQYYEQTDENDKCVSWLPIYHDMGLIASILQPTYVGYPAIFMDPVQFLQFPMRWLHAISRYRGSVTYAPNFAFEQCIRRAKPEDLATLDLSCWHIAVNGAEPIRSETMEHFLKVFGPCGFQPWTPKFAFGLAEATLVATSEVLGTVPHTQPFDKDALAQNKVVPLDEPGPRAWKLAGCGFPTLGQRIVIVRPEDRTRCASDEVGEIWLQGESVAQGYWQKPEATEEIFRARLSDGDEGPFLRTGDLGFVHGRHLYITGRLKDIIILNGRNHYPQDIELTVEQSHPALRPGCCVAFSCELAGSEQLVVMAEVNPRYSWSSEQGENAGQERLREVQNAIRRSIAEAHDIRTHDVVLLEMGEVLKTSSGKLQRRACRTNYLTGTLNRWNPA